MGGLLGKAEAFIEKGAMVIERGAAVIEKGAIERGAVTANVEANRNIGVEENGIVGVAAGGISLNSSNAGIVVIALILTLQLPDQSDNVHYLLALIKYAMYAALVVAVTVVFLCFLFFIFRRKEKPKLHPKTRMICIGNPGSGKSTLLNGLIGRPAFISGVTFGGTLTLTSRYEADNDGNLFIDTPSFSDSKTRNDEGHTQNVNRHFVIRPYKYPGIKWVPFIQKTIEMRNPLFDGTYLLFNTDGNRHPNKYMHVREDGHLQCYGSMDEDNFNDMNRHFVIKPYKIIDGDQTYLIYNEGGNRHPNKYVHIREDGHLQCYGPMDEKHTNNVNRHFVIMPYKVLNGEQTYMIYNKDGNRHPNKYMHIRNDGHLQCYGPMDEEHTQNVNRHFVIRPYDFCNVNTDW